MRLIAWWRKGRPGLRCRRCGRLTHPDDFAEDVEVCGTCAGDVPGTYDGFYEQ